MEQITNTMGMLDLMVRPGFCVANHIICKVNPAAQSRMIQVGDEISKYLATGSEEYAHLTEGCLYLTLNICGAEVGASVSSVDGCHVFLLEEDADQAELQAMALAAKELREPLTSIMTTADRLFPMAAQEEDPQIREQIARLNRGLFQMLRVVSNMSDANRYSSRSPSRQETRDIRSLLEEIFNRAQGLIAHTGIGLTFTNLHDPVFTLVDSEMLERTVLNILSNALKFTPKGGTIEAILTRRGNKLYLSVQDSGQGIPDELRGSIHSRYLRQPALEDSRFGIGLGMVLIRSTASAHGGAVLVDQPEGRGTRITMSLAIRQNPPGTVHSPMLQVDYAGERDHGLIELSDCLPAALYDAQKLN